MTEVIGTNSSGDGVRGTSNDGGAGVRGVAKGTWHDGVVGESKTSGHGTAGFAKHGDGIRGESRGGGAGARGVARGSWHDGVVGESLTSGHGVLGQAKHGSGLYGVSKGNGHGVYAIAQYGANKKIGGGTDGLIAAGAGVLGVGMHTSVMGLVNPGGWHSDYGIGNSKYSIGVCGAFPSNASKAPLPWDVDFVSHRIPAKYMHIGVYGMAYVGVLAVAPFSSGYGLMACNTAGGYAAAFCNKVLIEGDLEITGQTKHVGGDCAERFASADAKAVEPGSVMAMDEDGQLVVSRKPYDRKVAGVVSGAGDFQPGIVLSADKASAGGVQIALIGRVMCKVDAHIAPIEVGDLLTTSETPGHAMKAADPDRAFGAVIGKAMASLPDGQGMIPILVALQ